MIWEESSTMHTSIRLPYAQAVYRSIKAAISKQLYYISLLHGDFTIINGRLRLYIVLKSLTKGGSGFHTPTWVELAKNKSLFFLPFILTEDFTLDDLVVKYKSPETSL